MNTDCNDGVLIVVGVPRRNTTLVAAGSLRSLTRDVSGISTRTVACSVMRVVPCTPSSRPSWTNSGSVGIPRQAPLSTRPVRRCRFGRCGRWHRCGRCHRTSPLRTAGVLPPTASPGTGAFARPEARTGRNRSSFAAVARRLRWPRSPWPRRRRQIRTATARATGGPPDRRIWHPLSSHHDSGECRHCEETRPASRRIWLRLRQR